MRLSSTPFARLVSALKRTKATVTVTESTCGGLIQSSILAQPGASAVYYGGTVAYNTRRSKKFLLDDDELHASLIAPFDAGIIESGESERYVRTKIEWTRRTSAAFCERIGTDYAIAEGGAAGPTFRPRDLDRGFAAIAVARRDASTGDVEVVRERVVRSRHAHREKNMRLFADEAAKLALEAIVGEEAFEDEEVDGDGDGDEAPPPAPAPFMDRATLLRSDAAALDRLAPSARYVVLRGGAALFRPGSGRLALMSRDEVDVLAAASGARAETSFLGLTDAGDGPAGLRRRSDRGGRRRAGKGGIGRELRVGWRRRRRRRLRSSSPLQRRSHGSPPPRPGSQRTRPPFHGARPMAAPRPVLFGVRLAHGPRRRGGPRGNVPDAERYRGPDRIRA
mmetsp:Transcript_29609/g.87784  ORF Transcript_29609/g.87784 Transcript_29609/m.87784 type:complete len:394 (-) Transcript_29609:521-1702(-)